MCNRIMESHLGMLSLSFSKLIFIYWKYVYLLFYKKIDHVLQIDLNYKDPTVFKVLYSTQLVQKEVSNDNIDKWIQLKYN